MSKKRLQLIQLQGFMLLQLLGWLAEEACRQAGLEPIHTNVS